MEEVSEDSFDVQFSPDDVVWTPIRLRDAMQTVEWRSPDATLPSQILRLVEEVDTVMEQLHRTNVRIDGATGEVTSDGITLPEFETLFDYSEEAMYDGLESPNVAAYLERMGFDIQGYDPVARKIGRREYVAPDKARELRLRYGKLLKRDVQDLRRV